MWRDMKAAQAVTARRLSMGPERSQKSRRRTRAPWWRHSPPHFGQLPDTRAALAPFLGACGVSDTDVPWMNTDPRAWGNHGQDG
jgi:hypothetical protein